jgi:hypothetical protein
MQKEKFFPEMTTANILLAFQHLFAMFGATVIVAVVYRAESRRGDFHRRIGYVGLSSDQPA